MSSVRWSRTSAIWAADDSRGPRRSRRATRSRWKCSHACSASCSVRSSTNQEPPAGSSTRPRCDSSSSSSWVLRAMRRAKLAAVPGNPPGIAASNGCTSTVSAPPTPAPNAATVVRSMFTHGSRCAIIGIDVTACTRAAPASGSPTTSATLCPQPAQHARILAIVMNWSSSAASRKLICRNDSGTPSPASPSKPQVGRPPPRRHRPAPTTRWRRGCEVRAVDRDGPHATGVVRDLRAVATTSAMSAALRRLSGAVSGSAPRSIDSRARCSSSMSASCGSTASAAATKSAPAVEHHRHQVEKHALEQAVQLAGRDAVGRAHPQHQRADTFGQGDQHGAVAVGDRLLARRGKRLGDLPPRLDVAQRVAAADERPSARQRRLRQAVQAGVQRADREALIGRRIQQAFGLRRQVGRIAPGRFRQHAGDSRAPALLRLLQVRFLQARFLHVHQAK